MTRLRSNKEYVISTDQVIARRHPPRTPPKRPNKFVLAARKRSIRYLEKAQEYQVSTGENVDTLGNKLSWLHAEWAANRISGKAYRQLRDLYSKRNISKPRNKRVKLDDLTDDSKEQNRRLEAAFARVPISGADAGDEDSGAVSGNAVEETIESTADDQPLDAGSEETNIEMTEAERSSEGDGEGAAEGEPDGEGEVEGEGEGVGVEVGVEGSEADEDETEDSETSSETEDESSSEGDTISEEDGSSTPQATLPTTSRFATDAAAIEVVRALGYQLSEYYGGEPAQGGEEEEEGAERPIKEEGEGEVFIKMEPGGEEYP